MLRNAEPSGSPEPNIIPRRLFTVKPKTACLFVIASLIPSLAQAQQHRGSPEDQLACTPDVYRLCSQYIPDEDDIVACLQRKKPQLSEGCHAVFSRPDTAAPAPKQGEDD